MRCLGVWSDTALRTTAFNDSSNPPLASFLHFFPEPSKLSVAGGRAAG